MLIEVRIDRLYHGDKTLLRDVRISIATGEKALIVGRTGTGKTSLLHTLNRMNSSYEGVVLLEGQDVRALPPDKLRARVLEVPQEPVLPQGTVREAIHYPLRFATQAGKSFAPARVHELLEAVALPQDTLDRQIHTLSGGEKQRVALIRAMLLEPDVLLLDEPSSALDQTVSGYVADHLLCCWGGAIVAISHDPTWRRQFHRVLAIANQRLLDEQTEG